MSGYTDLQEFRWQKLLCFSPSLKQSTHVLCSLFFLEEVQGLIMKDFSFLRRGLAAVPSLSSLPNSSRILFPHVLPSSLESFFPSQLLLIFFSSFRLHHETFSSLYCPLQLTASFTWFSFHSFLNKWLKVTAASLCVIYALSLFFFSCAHWNSFCPLLGMCHGYFLMAPTLKHCFILDSILPLLTAAHRFSLFAF